MSATNKLKIVNCFWCAGTGLLKDGQALKDCCSCLDGKIFLLNGDEVYGFQSVSSGLVEIIDRNGDYLYFDRDREISKTDFQKLALKEDGALL